MRKVVFTLLGLVAFIVVAITVSIMAVRFADGPKGPFAGGPIREGVLITDGYTSWLEELGGVDGTEVQFHLESTTRSRTTGSIVHNDQLYIPCDLGFIWQRYSGSTRLILQTMNTFKTWHEDAMANGDILLRIGDKLYERTLVRVKDAEILNKLKQITERQVDQSYMGPLPDRPSDPDAIWYFRVEPRT